MECQSHKFNSSIVEEFRQDNTDNSIIVWHKIYRKSLCYRFASVKNFGVWVFTLNIVWLGDIGVPVEFAATQKTYLVSKALLNAASIPQSLSRKSPHRENGTKSIFRLFFLF